MPYVERMDKKNPRRLLNDKAKRERSSETSAIDGRIQWIMEVTRRSAFQSGGRGRSTRIETKTSGGQGPTSDCSIIQEEEIICYT